MKKRVNLIAVLFWLIGVFFLFGDIPIVVSIREVAAQVAQSQGAVVAHGISTINIWQETRSAVLYGGQLIGIGVLIELVDQIRWNALHRPFP